MPSRRESQRYMKIRHHLWVAAALFLGIQSAHSQLLEDIELQREGNNAVLQVRFVTPVQLQRWTTSQSGNSVQVYYGLVPTAQRLNLIVSERRLEQLPGFPRILLTDEDAIRDGVNRRLLVNFDARTRYKIRQGRDQRTLDVVLEGLGPAVTALTSNIEEGAPDPSSGRPAYSVRLQSTRNRGQTLPASIPAEFQAQVTHTLQRVVAGQTYYETYLGDFATRAEAERARARLIRRFPDAVVAEPASTPTAPPASAATAVAAPALPTQAVPPVAAATASAAPPLPASVVSSTPTANATAPTKTAVPDATARSTNLASPDQETRAKLLLSGAEQAFAQGSMRTAIETLNALLELPENSSSRRAHQLIGLARLRSGDTKGAKREFDLFIELYPKGTDSDQVRRELAGLPAEVFAAPRTAKEPLSVTTGSVSLFYYGGQSQVRTQEFQNSPISGLPVLQSDSSISGNDLKQLQAATDLNWRYRDDEKDMRLVFRDSYSADLLPNGSNRQRLTAMYFDMRSFVNGTNFRVGRQSPTGGGVLYRFDGLQAGYTFAPKWRVNTVMGKPSDDLLDTQRRFAGISIEAEALTPALSGNLYTIQQTVDGELDRKAYGTELRYFKGGLSMFGQVDYDQVFSRYNILSLQGTNVYEDNSVFNFLVDRRTSPLLSLGNALFFQDPSTPTVARTIRELLAGTSMDTLIARVKGITPYQNQAMVGYTTPISPKWQTGTTLNYTSIDEIPPVDLILPQGQAATGNLWSAGLQFIGSNLYSARDTHVFNVNWLTGPTYNGQLYSYNNLSGLNDNWQVEPSLRYYTQGDNTDTRTARWTPGLRLTYRPVKKVSIETEAQYEISKTSGPTRQEDATRLFYYLGGRYDF